MDDAGTPGRVAFVTGAGSSSGIGFATARTLGRDGASVALASTTERIHDRANELGGEGIHAVGPSHPGCTEAGTFFVKSFATSAHDVTAEDPMTFHNERTTFDAERSLPVGPNVLRRMGIRLRVTERGLPVELELSQKALSSVQPRPTGA